MFFNCEVALLYCPVFDALSTNDKYFSVSIVESESTFINDISIGIYHELLTSFFFGIMRMYCQAKMLFVTSNFSFSLIIFSPNGRFRDLNSKLKKLKEHKKSALLILLLLSTTLSNNGFGQHTHSKNEKEAIHRVISAPHSDELASLLVQNYEGRIVPFHSLSDQLLRKIHGKNKYKDLNCVQVIMSMHMYPDFWAEEKFIAVPAVLQERLKLKKHVSVTDLVASNGNFKWLAIYQNAFQKSESKRDEFDKKIIKLNEKFEVTNSIFAWQYMRIIPKKNDANSSECGALIKR